MLDKCGAPCYYLTRSKKSNQVLPHTKQPETAGGSGRGFGTGREADPNSAKGPKRCRVQREVDHKAAGVSEEGNGTAGTAEAWTDSGSLPSFVRRRDRTRAGLRSGSLCGADRFVSFRCQDACRKAEGVNRTEVRKQSGIRRVEDVLSGVRRARKIE